MNSTHNFRTLKKSCDTTKATLKGKPFYVIAMTQELAISFITSPTPFENLGLKKLIMTCYKNQEIDLFSRQKI